MKRISAMVLAVLMMVMLALPLAAEDNFIIFDVPETTDEDNYLFYGGASSVTITAQPIKLTYYVGEDIDLTGLTLKVTYSSGATATVMSGFDVSGFDSSRTGNQTVTVTVSGVSATFSVTVKALPYSRGDMNGDGKVNSADAVLLLRHILRPSRYLINQSGDVNGDDNLNSADAIYLLRHTLRPSRYPLA